MPSAILYNVRQKGEVIMAIVVEIRPVEVAK